MYVLAGCYTAVHLQTLLGLLRAHRRRLLIWALGGLAFTELAYIVQTAWMDPRSANNPLQPVMVVCSASVVILLVLAGDAWSRGSRVGLRAIRRGSDISFGVYLLHPVVLTLLCNAGLGNQVGHLPSAAATALAVPATAVAAVGVCLILRRTPLALPLIGRSWVRPDPGRLPVRERLAGHLPRPLFFEHAPKPSDIIQEPLMPSSGSIGTTLS